MQKKQDLPKTTKQKFMKEKTTCNCCSIKLIKNREFQKNMVILVPSCLDTLLINEFKSKEGWKNTIRPSPSEFTIKRDEEVKILVGNFCIGKLDRVMIRKSCAARPREGERLAVYKL